MNRLPPPRVIILMFLMALLSSRWTTQAVAQSGEIGLTVVEVESQAFPRVAVLVAADGPQGPVEGLSAADFQIDEEGTAVPTEAIEVEASHLPNLRLVLGLDVSGAPADLAQAQQAALALIDTLSPQDRAAIMSFGDNVRLVRDFTNNTAELRTAVEGLAAIGSLTALNEALVEAVDRLDQGPPGRRGIVLITNRLDNTQAPPSVAESLALARTARIPIHVIGFGPDVPATPPLEAQLNLTGGRYLRVPTAASIGAGVEETAELLRQGYRITFRSAIKADDAEHDFSIGVAGQESQAGGRFQAIPGAVAVAVSGLAPGQTVSGPVQLSTQVTAPAPVASVEYLLDGQPLATVTELPYSLDWDSASVGPGTFTLIVRATDNAGNVGQTELDFSIAVPVQVSLTTPQSEVRVGDAVPLQANIEATSELVRVDFLLDDIVVDSKTEPPYQFDLDSSRYTPGSHVITLRVEDSLGYVGEDSLTLQFLPKPLPQPTWFERFVNNPWVRLGAIVALGLLALTGLVLLALLLLRMIRRAQHRLSWRHCRLEILNWGNISSYYRLQARDALGGLNFQFSLNGDRLPLYAPPPPAFATGRVTSSPVMPVSSPATPVSRPVPAAEDYSASRASASTGQEGGARQALGKAEDAHSQASGCLYTISDILESLAFLLPGPAGSFLRRTSQQLTRGQYAVDQAIRTPVQMARTAEHIRNQAGELVPSRSTETSGYPQAQTPSGPVAPEVVTPVVERGGYPSAETPRRNLYQKNGPSSRMTEVWAETPMIEPEQRLVVDLLIVPANPYQRQDYPFTLLSKPAEQEQAPMVTEQGVVELPGISWFWRYVPGFLVMLVTLGLLIGVIWLTIWRLNESGILTALASA